MIGFISEAIKVGNHTNELIRTVKNDKFCEIIGNLYMIESSLCF